MRQKITGTADYILPLGILGILGFVAYKFLGPSAAGSANNSQNDANNKAAAAQAFTTSSASVPQSMTDSQLSSIATQISTAPQTGGSGDTDNVVYQLSLINNITDWYRLVQLFGSKAAGAGFFSTCSLFGFDCNDLDLVSFIKVLLSADDIATVNQNFAGNGINITI